MRWGLSILGFHHHAIDERRMHPIGVYKAECGHLLTMVTPLHEEPYGRLCSACAAIQASRAVTRHDSDRPPVEPHQPSPLVLPVAGRSQTSEATMGKHSNGSSGTVPWRWPRPVEMVELGTGLTHLLTPDALATGRKAKGRYVALCRAVLLPAPLVEAGKGYCRVCVPPQRSKSAR